MDKLHPIFFYGLFNAFQIFDLIITQIFLELYKHSILKNILHTLI